jgi:cytochrome c oxidase subunit 3
MSSELLADNPHRAEHFPTYDAQKAAARLGMWLFLGTEVLLFAGLFVLYACYRWLYPQAFSAGSHELSLTAGTLNTVVLIVSSFFVAMSLHFGSKDARWAAIFCLGIALLLGLGFLGVKAWEWSEHFREGALPDRWYAGGKQIEGLSLFFTLYFLMTGLHAVHVIAGMAALTWAASKVYRRQVSSEHDTPLELCAMYWHLVDIVWIFLYPLLYLVK